MKNVIALHLLFLMILLFALQSCEKKTENLNKENSTYKKNELKKVIDTFKSPLRPNENIQLEKIFLDTVQFVNFNDNGDDRQFIVKKNKDTVRLIYNNDDPKFIRGDELEIKWKMDSLRPAGDPEYLDYSEYLISAKVIKPLKLADKKVKFLWRKFQYDKELSTDINTIILNKNYIKSISDPEKAALAYAATFIGNECGWDGKADDNRGNLKCKILTALNLGYQCSDQHLGFLRFWFRNNQEIMKELENCPTTPDGATVQDTFDEINLQITGNKITVFFKASGVNLREGKSWNWTEKHFFEFKKNELLLLKKEISPTQHSNFEVEGN
ncbi:hypothetical protein [Chryseobacterium gregarium]|uniref:hypothetical protein n=1 Tax=Chryseobacterium gregarium TaxID=456299 RepID=UPI0004033209|nr:hypothetical protein [Chryseobacterium gregarium]